MKRSVNRLVAFLVLLSLVLSMIPAVSAAEATTATLVTDVSSLQAGDRIIIVAAGYDYALSTEQKTNNRGQSAITKNEDGTVTYAADTQIITLGAGSVDGTFGFSVGDSQYLYAASSSGNYLKTTATLSANASWAITIDASTGVAGITASGDYARNTLRYNTSSGLFSCYAATNSQKDVCIYEVGGESGGNGLVTDASTLQVGDQIIIAAAGYDYALSTEQKTNNRGQAAITKNEDGTVTYADDAQIITLEAGSVDGTFAFRVGDSQYLYAASSSGNYLKTAAAVSANASWTITIDASTGAASIVAGGDYTRNTLRYNSSSGLFSCYAAANSQKDICIYEVTGSGSGSTGDSGDSGSSGGSGSTDTSGCNHDWSSGSCTKCGMIYVEIITDATGYTTASEVVYNTVDGYITNWGARGEECVFLSTYAQAFYTDGYTFDTLSDLSGGTSSTDAPGSELYTALQELMVDNHTTFTKYGGSTALDCKNFYQYTDCLKNNTNYVSTIYRGLYVTGAWDGGVSYNQEHIWPNSKCIGTNSTDVGDIMHLRAANPSENSSRNNTAYGESADYYDPGLSVRGDCARTILYLYTRWGNTEYMWGVDGVMESLDILLKWIEEDPVDTWEMGHNDAVESITGTRNVFVDYPEYAFLLFGEEVPADMVTPSSDADGNTGGGTEPEPETPAAVDYYLFGYINGANYACEEDYANMGQYKFVDGKLTATFTETSYVAVKTTGNANWYMTNDWQGEVTSATLYNTSVTGDSSNKLYVPGGVEVTFTLVDNGNDTLTLSYVTNVEESVVPTITPKYPTLSFESEIFINVYFDAANIEDVVEMGLVTYAAADSINNAEDVIPGAVLEANGYYSVRTNGIPAKQLGDTVYFRVYAKLADGTYVYSNTYNYSALAYAKDRLANSTNADLKALCVAMLNYGAAAQTHMNYNTGALANATLTAAQLALVDSYRSDMVASVVSVNSSKVGSFAYNSAGYTTRYPNVSFEGAFAINYYFAPAKAVEGEMTLYYWDLETYNRVSKLTASNATGSMTMTNVNGTYEGTVAGIAAKEIDETVFVAGVYTFNGVTYATGVLPYSLGAYCVDRINNGSGTMRSLAEATAVYGYYAKVYFGA